MEVAFKFVERAIDFVLEASIRQLGYIFCYKRNVKELEDRTNVLKDKREIVAYKIEVVSNNAENNFSGPENWCREAKEKIEDCNKFKNDKTHKKTGCSRSILFVWYRHKLGRKAAKMAKEVESLTSDSRQNDEVLRKENPGSSHTALSNVGYLDVESRKNTMKEIMKQLEESTVRMIGVCGPSGVGKTTFVKEIAKQAKDNNLFDVVIMVSITSDPNLQRIQEEIANHLGLTFEGESESRRADRLGMRLKQKKASILMILDDLWDELDLHMLGISFEDDDLGHRTLTDKKDSGYKTEGKEEPPSDYDSENEFKRDKNKHSPSAYKGCKMLLTSRAKEVLGDKMNVKKLFYVGKLEKMEAETFFKNVADITDDDHKFNPEIVSKIVEYCAGLPMAIVIAGKALKNKSKSVWEDRLEKLKKYELIGVQNSLQISMKMSYDHLESEELKSIFLLCAQMGHQPLIVDLVKYCIGLGILKGVHTLGDARDRVLKSIDDLKGSSLLLDDDSRDHFNMHDMHREAALSIAHRDKNVFILRNDKLDVWPTKDELERCTVISIYKSDIVDELPEVINCPRLRVFHIDSDFPTLNIPDRFFDRMEELGVLILTGINLLTLPSSIKCLSNLRMLCLERCDLGNLSFIKYLKKLRILSLSGSKMEDLPAELVDLSKLQLLDISDCFIANSIPPCFISSLSSLEELYVRKSLIKMEVEGETNQIQISVFSQLKHLHELKIIDVCIPNADVFSTDLFFDKLNDYKIVIGDFMTLSIGNFKMPNKYEASRTLALQLQAGMDIHPLTGIKMLFKRVENLLLGELNGVQSVVCELNLDGFPDLKNLSVVNNTDIEYIVNSMELSHPLDAFPKLEHLNLFNLMNIRNICCSPVTDGSFSRLKTINVKMCTKLKNLFSFNVVKFLVNLEIIDASECDYLEEIVVDEGEVSDKVKFHKLCSLTVQELPSFVSFYTNNKTFSIPLYMDRQARHTDHMEIVNAKNEQSVATYLSLFGEKVEIPNLESLNLSSIKIHKIWSDQLSSFCFQNLIKLTVDDCCNLTYLCSLSVASNLNKLKGLFVSNCRMMETLFATEEDSNYYSKECIFPKLEEIQLIDMNMLKDIWPAEVSANSFPGLISVHIEKCGKLDKIFPSHMQGWYQSLDSLKVVYCDSVEVIFEIRCPPQQGAFKDDTKLKIIFLKSLPNLKQIWSRDPEGVVNFTNLRSINVFGCYKLSYVLPVSVAKGLAKLEDFSIQSCHEMEEIVPWVAGLETINEPLVFPEITYMCFYRLQNIKCFYKGRQIIDCPNLKRLVVIGCPELKAFTTESTTEEGRTIFSAEKVISNLERLDIGQKEAEWLKSNTGMYRMQRMKYLCLYELPSVEILYWFLHRIPNLEGLRLYSSPYSIRELVPSGNTAPRQRLGAVWQLKILNLFFSSIEDIGFERDPLLQRLERLVLYRCDSLIKLAHHTVSFTQLTYLEVSFCSKLKKLMAASTAKSLVRLTTMKVMDCVELEEIVTNDDEGNEEEKVVGNIVFGKLITIELESLRKLTCFCSYKNCDISFPLLEKLILKDCPKMKTFTQSRTRAPKLQNVLVAERRFEGGEWYWEGDLNSTIQKVSVDKSRLELSGYPELEQVWCGKDLVSKNSFRNVKCLVVANIGYLVHVIPPHLLPCFKNLEELQVHNCDAVQVIFNINDNRVTKAMGMFRLKKLSLRKLPMLEYAWDRDPEGIFGLQALRDLSVQECSSLKYVFPASMAKDLAMLKMLSIVDCEQLVEIFAEDIETASEGYTKSFVFHRLTSLELRSLSELKYFYPGLHNLEFPVLEELHLHQCNWVILCCQEAEAYLEVQVLVAVEKVNLLIHNLRNLSFDTGAATVIWDLKSNKLTLKHLLYFSEKSDCVLFQFLQTVPNIEKLKVSHGSLKEMFSAERPNADNTRVLSHLKGLTLYELNDLKSIGLEHSWIHPIPENLQKLKVEGCDQLKNLVPAAGTVSFSNLTDLVVSDCDNLLYLFTSSTAKSLARLKLMEIRNCESMQEIVSTEGDESQESGQIIFEQLRSLSLKELSMLRCFYSGNYTLCFPSLEKVSVTYCVLMKTFCPLIMINQDLVKLFSGSEFIDEDVNTAIRKMNEETIVESALELKDWELDGFEPHIQELWRGLLLVPNLCFSNLESLVVDGCEFLSEVIPSNFLPFLNKMHKLEVRNCSSMKTIFDVKCITKDRKMSMGPAFLPHPFSLKTLVLEKLPNLESVWNVDSHCEGLSEIVARVEIAPEAINPEFTFPSLTSLTLLDLPKLKCFYCSLCCIQLKRLDQDPHIEDQGCAKEITPNLDNLSLGEKELKMVWHGQCQGNHLHKIKVLDLQGFNVESNELPYGSLQKVPNIEELVVSYSSFKEVFCDDRPNVDSTGFLSQLKGLKLASLSELTSIGLEHPWVEESFLKNLETLEATSCSRLGNLVPSSICFSSLVRLTVSNCEDMIHLFNTSTAKSLAQLKHMDISRCKSIQEIVSIEGGESHHEEIVFGQLQELNLKYLRNLESFYKGSLTLSFPSLVKLSVFDCGRMDTFCAGTIMANKLSAVKFDNGDNTPLEDDLNFTIHKTFKAKIAEFVKEVKNLKLLDKPEIYAIWHGSFPVPLPRFINLKSLIVERCEFLSTVIPSHILCLLCKLEELEVRQCHSVNTIFEVKDMIKGKKKLTNAEPAFSPCFRLKKLTFEQLLNLEHVWDSDPEEVIGIQNLQEVYVNGCDRLERLFAAPVAKRLTKLEKLEVQHCGRLVEIVAKDEAAKEGATEEFVMPCMSSIKLWFLPELECFYPGPHKLECPKLTQVHLFHCDKLKTFTCESQSLPEAQSGYQVGIPLNPQALFLAEEIIPYLEFPVLSKEESMMIGLGQLHVNLLHKLQALHLQCFHDDSDTFPCGLLQKVPNIEKFALSCSSFKEIFSSKRPELDCVEEILSHLKCLQLSSLSKLNSIGLEHSWVAPFSENLGKLKIDQCHCLRNIVPCKVSFSSLIDLNVSQCGGLVSLFTLSTSRTLSQLKNMSIANCASLEEIVFEEAEESSNDDDEEQITFHKLETLSLHSLPRLGRFYGGSVALSFPSLDELSVINCSKMESFCGGAISVNVNRWTTIKFKEDEDPDTLKVDLNSAVRKEFEGTLF